ncbi:FAD-binding and (Fe-S)-binding domain-containing protein [Ideonella livida]|uniref:D-lactate dehydrogenase (cytochrome) n=1 Tax=Ideonella livida TaxID=2707176 RepID=A0A7C9PFA7_9BURK|nr:FAD-binding and (Fe-S)-binding domain-containing protein [Ideonella livida]NDY90375.1 FAD-binding oxidoreductase [Ideonella livida]
MTPQHQAFLQDLGRHVPAERLVTDPLRTLAYGTDASFYRLVPQVVVLARDEAEVAAVLALAQRHEVAVTLRAAGTSLSGQAVSDSVLVVIGEGWTGIEVLDDGARIRLQPGVIGQHANDALRRFGRKIGPDPASIATARIGGMAANNSSGMCCGTAQNGYHTLAALRVMLADGTVLDTADAASVAAFRRSHLLLLNSLQALAQRIRGNAELLAKVRRKYRLKNTTGYGINALIDFEDPVDMLAHLMIGSEGTLGFISQITYHTVPDHPHKASCLVLFAELEDCCRAVTALKDGGAVDAVELVDRRSILAIQGKKGLPAFLYGEPAPSAAALLIETRGADAAELAARCAAITATLQAYRPAADSGFSTDAAVCETYWAVRKGLFPAVGAQRAVGTTCVIEDVAFPVEKLAEGVLRLTALFDTHGYTEALIFGHALEGNLHFVFAPSFDSPAEVQRYSDFMDEVSLLVAVEFGGSLKAEHGTGRNVAPFVKLEWGDEAYEVMCALKALFDPAGLLNPDVIISRDDQIHLKALKAMPAADSLVDRCIECGFCEPACPSNGLSLTPRQRIVAWRRMQQLRRDGSAPAELAALEADYGWAGLDTCAATGMCATRCPVGINTGDLVKKLRGPSRHAGLADRAESHLGAVLGTARAGLGVLRLAKGVLGAQTTAAVNRTVAKIVPVPVAPVATPGPAASMPQPPKAVAGGAAKAPVVYFSACVNRVFAESPKGGDHLASSAFSLLDKAGFVPVLPPGQDSLCCGQPFDSHGATEAAERALQRTGEALLAASDQGRIPVYLDNAPCSLRLIEAQRAGKLDARLKLHDAVSFLADAVLPKVALTPKAQSLAVHVPCSTSRLGAGAKLVALAKGCATEVTVPDIACCGFAGDKGFTRPELNANSLKRLKPALPEGCGGGVSCSRTCQIGLSSHGGIPYRSIEALLDDCAVPASAS